MSLLGKIFGKRKTKKEIEQDIPTGFHTGKDIMVDTDIAFREPAYKRIKEIESKLLINPEDYKNLKFDEKIDLNDYNLSDLSQETKKKILELIVLDTEIRLGQRPTQEFQSADDPFKLESAWKGEIPNNEDDE
jgi:hypothetical protein